MVEGSQEIVDSKEFELEINYDCKNSSHYVPYTFVDDVIYIPYRFNYSSYGVPNLYNATIADREIFWKPRNCKLINC